jgi:hypothetical protein
MGLGDLGVSTHGSELRITKLYLPYDNKITARVVLRSPLWLHFANLLPIRKRPMESFGLLRNEVPCHSPGRVDAGMPINRLLKEGKFKPEEVERLNRAFALALSLLGLVDRNDPICEMVARKVIDIDAAGTHEPEEIAKLAVARLGP